MLKNWDRVLRSQWRKNGEQHRENDCAAGQSRSPLKILTKGYESPSLTRMGACVAFVNSSPAKNANLLHKRNQAAISERG